MNAITRTEETLARRTIRVVPLLCLLLAVLLPPSRAAGAEDDALASPLVPPSNVSSGSDAFEADPRSRDDGRADAANSIASVPDPIALAPDDVRSLLNWAVLLSRYAPGAEVPEVRLESSAFFAANACGGRPGKCRVLGWYADRGVVHVHERFADLSSLFAQSLVVHELVHYLQDRSGLFPGTSCASFVEREREAYAAQQGFFVAYGAMPTLKSHHFACPSPDDFALASEHGT